MRIKLLLLILCCCSATLRAQTIPADDRNNLLFTAGVGAGLIGGLYDGFLSYGKLKEHGDFGLGAPDKLDGEIVVFRGHVYQTRHTGLTTETDNRQLTSFSMVNFFRPDTTVMLRNVTDKNTLFRLLDSLLPNANGMYAIHVSGMFRYMKTRAFPPVTAGQHTPLADMLSKQQFFEFRARKGDLIGYRLPVFMDNTNISGYHFHFLAEEKNAGGHLIDLQAGDLLVEIDILHQYSIQLPATKDFEHFDFKKNREEEIKSVEKGSR